uniref:HAUS augmin like complex subunit 8 n=1 Tax=Oryctolagus cuniculus TaxID=9986 RepID=G1TKH4_RABIT
AADTAKTSGKAPEGGRKASQPQRSRDGSGFGKGDLQSTMLEGHGAAPPDLDLSAINDRSALRKTPQLDRSLSKRAESASFSAPRRKGPDLCEEMELMESQTLLLTLLAVKMENGLARFEEQAEQDLLRLGQERERLRETAHALRRRLLVSQRKRELAGALTAQTELLRPFEAAAVQRQYVNKISIIMTRRCGQPGPLSSGADGPLPSPPDALQPELNTAHRLLGELGVGSAEPTQALALLSELRGLAVEKDLELRRSFAQVLELSTEASKEAALLNQRAWEEAQGPAAPSRWYFREDGAPRPPLPGALASPGVPWTVEHFIGCRWTVLFAALK